MHADKTKTWLPGQSNKQRNGKGSVLSLLPVIVLMGLFGLGALGLDVAHNVTTRTSLQDASDAAALAGAAYLVVGDPNAGAYPATNDPSSSAPSDQTSSYSGAVVTAAENEAITIAASNQSDGRMVSQALTPGCTVVATINQPSSPNSGSTVPGHNGQCVVNSAIPINNMFAGIFGHKTDIVAVTSIATAYSSVNSVSPNTVFPIAVSLDTVFGHNPTDNSNKPLYMCNIGDTETFTLSPEICANASWTTFDLGANNDPNGGYSDGAAATYISNAFASATGTNYQQNLIHSQYVGQSQGLALWADLNTGSQPNITSIYGQTVNLPVMSGDGPYRSGSNSTVTQPGTPTSGYNSNQNMDHVGCRPLVGFIGFKITGSTTDADGLSTITGTIVKTLVKGTPGCAFPQINITNNPNITGGDATLATALANLSPAVVLLGNNVTGSSNGLNSGSPGNTQTYSSGGGFSQTAEQNAGPIINESGAGNGFVQSNLQNIPLPQWMEGTSITQAQVDGVNVSGSEGTFFNAVPEYVNGQLQSTRQAVGFTNYMIQENTANQTVTVVFVDEVNLDGAPANGNTQSNPVPSYNITTGQPDASYGPQATLWTGTNAASLQQLPVNPSITTVTPISNAELISEGGHPDTQNGNGSPSYNYQITVKLPPLNSAQLPLYLQVAAHDTDRSNDFGIQIFNLQFGASQCPVN